MSSNDVYWKLVLFIMLKLKLLLHQDFNCLLCYTFISTKHIIGIWHHFSYLILSFTWQIMFCFKFILTYKVFLSDSLCPSSHQYNQLKQNEPFLWQTHKQSNFIKMCFFEDHICVLGYIKLVYSGTCLIRHMTGSGKCVRLWYTVEPV